MKKQVVINIPATPNFLFDENGTQYSISQFTTEELIQIGKEWTDMLIKKSKEKQKNVSITK